LAGGVEDAVMLNVQAALDLRSQQLSHGTEPQIDSMKDYEFARKKSERGAYYI